MDSTFDRKGLLDLLTQLGAELEAEGLHGQVFLVGGAALALAYGARRLTRDVDGMFEPKTRVYEAAARVAAHNGLSDDWFNDSVKGADACGGFRPGDGDVRAWFGYSGGFP